MGFLSYTVALINQDSVAKRFDHHTSLCF
jgi:hypothetical protein